MIQDYRNVIGDKTFLVIIAKKAKTKRGWRWFKNTEMVLVSKLSWYYKEGGDKVRMIMIQKNRKVIGD